MTVALYAAKPPRTDYVEDGSTTVHSTQFAFFDPAEITCTRILVDGTEVALVQPTHYSVTGGGGEVGSVTKVNGGVDGATFRIDRNTALSQLAVWSPGDDFPAEQVQEAFDRLEMQMQEVRRDLIQRTDLTDILAAILIAGDGIELEVDETGGTITINNTAATAEGLTALLGDILLAGTGIELTVVDGTVTITNTSSGAGSQDCLLLASGVGDGSTGAEDVRDIVGTALRGLGCTITVDDAANTITVDLTQAVTLELIRDAIAAALVAGSGISVTVDDPGNTITIALDDERIRDAIGACLVAGAGITITVDDAGNTITIAATGLDSTYKGIVPTDQAGAFNFADTMNGRSTRYTGSAAAATLRPEATHALPAGWTHVVRNVGSGPLTITRGAGVSLKANGSATSANVAIAPDGVATIIRWAADDFTISGSNLS
jgi:hypothetical protein